MKKATAPRKVKVSRKPTILTLGSMTTPVRRAGGEVVSLAPTDEKAIAAAQHADAVILAGGGDVDPTWYAETRHARVYGVNERRDIVEMSVLDVAAERGIPVLGICRGSQVMNVWAGGTLHQHIPDIPGTHGYHQGHQHRVTALEGSRLRKAMGVDEAWVTSIHHQAVAEVADGFVATAWGLDGTIETIEAVDRWWVGVQYHPEMAYETSKPMQGIFDALVREAAKVAGLPAPRRERPVKVKVPAKKKSTNVRRAVDARRSGGWFHDDGSSPKAGPVITRFVCFRCDVEFDERDDHVDHMLYMHDVDMHAWDEVSKS